MRPIKKTICLLLSLLLLVSCEKDLPQFFDYGNYQFSGNDERGGNWKPVLLPSSGDIPLEAPQPAGSAQYQAELADLRGQMAKMTPEQKESIAYWSANPVLRWNEIALELIAKYNLIPGYNEDGTYSLPSAAQPEGPPAFPFAHPPYASRALAYLSVAQYDGMLSAWHYKYSYKRAAPYQQDASIAYAYDPTTIPSYPSDGAVVAAVSRQVLTVMFPLEKEYLQKRETEHLQSLILSGGNVASDVQAGIEIGNKISAIALARAANDGMKFAQCTKAVSDSIKAAAFARFGWQWDNLEVPVRPVGLTPLFGKVKMWNVPNVLDTRPKVPPTPGSPEFQADVKILKDYATNSTVERRRIANFWQDGLATYTPPGHWNRFAKEFIVKYKQNPLRSARTFAYMNMAIMDGGISCWDAKYYYHYPRPIQKIEGFKTIAGTPNFPSYTSGHSVFSAAAAEVLAYIFPDEAGLVRGWAEEAAISRVYGGIHWTFDAIVGTDQGKNVARYSIDKAKADGADF